jgi:hypothetical protein
MKRDAAERHESGVFPDAKVFVGYEGKLSQRFQEHAVSGGLRLRF